MASGKPRTLIEAFKPDFKYGRAFTLLAIAAYPLAGADGSQRAVVRQLAISHS